MLILVLIIAILVATIFLVHARCEKDKRLVLEYKLEALKAQCVSIEKQSLAQSNDLDLLSRNANLLFNCADLPQALSVSDVVMPNLLPDSTGTVYPLTQDFDVAEACLLWGADNSHTEPMATERDCFAMQSKSVYLSDNSKTGNPACPHFHFPDSETPMSAACIPLSAQGQSLGWLHILQHGTHNLPKLNIAQAAAEQLSQTLSNINLRESLREQSIRDPLTDLFNRRYLTESLNREITRCARQQQSIALLLFDLDHFKKVNDTHGHAAGDALLIEFAKLLRNYSRNEDIACRLGGEEFLLAMPGMSLANALQRATELLNKTRELRVYHDGTVLTHVTASIGIAMFPEHAQNQDRLIHLADYAMYQAKIQGRDCYTVANISES